MNVATVGSRTLIETLYKPTTPAKRALLALGGAIAVAVLARFSIPLPFTPVPVTGQTLGVLLVGAVLGSSLGFRSLLLYLSIGALGVPVFAGGGAGLAWLLGPSGGYLAAFPLAAWLTGALVERFGVDRRPVTSFFAMLAGSALIYAGGLTWLGVYLSFSGGALNLGHLLALGFYPFIAGDIFKAILAAALLPGAWRLVSTFGGGGLR